MDQGPTRQKMDVLFRMQHKQFTNGHRVSGASEVEQMKNKDGCGNPDNPQQPEQVQTYDWKN